VAKYPYMYPYPFKQGNFYPYPIRIRENCGYPQNIYPRIHIRASLTSPVQHASRWRMRGSQTCRLLHRPRGLARMRHREDRRDREFMLGNSRTKLPARCMLGRRGDFEELADRLSMLPLWFLPCYWQKKIQGPNSQKILG